MANAQQTFSKEENQILITALSLLETSQNRGAKTMRDSNRTAVAEVMAKEALNTQNLRNRIISGL